MYLLAAIRLVVLAGMLLVGHSAQAAYPCSVIKIITPVGAGQTFAAGQLMAETLQRIMGVTVILEPKPGAGGSLGVLDVVRASPDGCTVLYGISSALTLPFMESKPYNAQADLQAVSLTIEVAPAVMLGYAGGFCSFESFASAARARSGVLNVGANNFAFGHLAQLALLGAAGLQTTAVPFKSENDAVAQLAGGHIDAAFVLAPTALGAIAGGKVCPLVQVATERNRYLRNIPSMKDVGVSGADFRVLNALLLPKGTPKGVVDELALAVEKMKADPDFIKRMEVQASTPVPGGPKETALWLQRVSAEYAGVINKYYKKGK